MTRRLFATAILLLLAGCRRRGDEYRLEPPAPTRDLISIDDLHLSRRDIRTTDGDALVIAGHWVPKSQYELSVIPALNAICIYCDRTTRRCEEAMAVIWTKRNFPSYPGPPRLLAVKLDYEIVTWSDSTVVATRHVAAGIDTLSVNLKGQSVELRQLLLKSGVEVQRFELW